MFKQIKPGEKIIGDISFAVDNLNRNFWLTFFDKKKGTPLTKISVDNAYKKVSKKTKKDEVSFGRWLENLVFLLCFL